EAGEGKLQEVRGAIGCIRSEQVVSFEFRGLGLFHNEKNPRVFWAGVEASTNLKALAADIEGAMEKLRFPREKREFSPHLTLARFESSRLPEALRKAITANAPREFGSLC